MLPRELQVRKACAQHVRCSQSRKPYTQNPRPYLRATRPVLQHVRCGENIADRRGHRRPVCPVSAAVGSVDVLSEHVWRCRCMVSRTQSAACVQLRASGPRFALAAFMQQTHSSIALSAYRHLSAHGVVGTIRTCAKVCVSCGHIRTCAHTHLHMVPSAATAREI